MVAMEVLLEMAVTVVMEEMCTSLLPHRRSVKMVEKEVQVVTVVTAVTAETCTPHP